MTSTLVISALKVINQQCRLYIQTKMVLIP